MRSHARFTRPAPTFSDAAAAAATRRERRGAARWRGSVSWEGFGVKALARRAAALGSLHPSVCWCAESALSAAEGLLRYEAGAWALCCCLA